MFFNKEKGQIISFLVILIIGLFAVFVASFFFTRGRSLFDDMFEGHAPNGINVSNGNSNITYPDLDLENIIIYSHECNMIDTAEHLFDRIEYWEITFINDDEDIGSFDYEFDAGATDVTDYFIEEDGTITNLSPGDTESVDFLDFVGLAYGNIQIDDPDNPEVTVTITLEDNGETETIQDTVDICDACNEDDGKKYWDEDGDEFVICD